MYIMFPFLLVFNAMNSFGLQSIVGSMAKSYSFPAPIPIGRPAGSRLVMRAHNQISFNTKPLQIRSFSKNKVFEDVSTGIVCHRDDNGEITCEGFDEGPRFHHQLSRFTCNSRDIEIVDLLQRCWDAAADFNKGI